MVTTFRPHILVVDDDPEIHEALRAALVDRYTVHAVATGAEACACLRAHPIAVIILDAFLRDEHGLALVEPLRTIRAVPMILLTGHSSEELAIRAVRHHVADYLKKPCALLEVLAAIGRLVPHPARSVGLAARARLALDEYPPKPFRAADLAHQLGVGEAHLRQTFRAAYGTTPRRYLTEVRLQRARTLFHTTGQSVKEVASAVGLSNALALRRAFRKLLGVPPHASRRDAVESTAAD